ncbi:MAG: hypothetical protein K2W82_12790 [Candidatus Obscuribacterales bacterium]|nr:hypothetical protein [Candidatus Obscuribacterales bacterium]
MNLSKNLAAFGLLIATAAPALAVPVEVSLPGEAKLGDTVVVSVKTDANAKCKIEAQDAGFTQMLKLFDQTADANGKASWKFDIPRDYKADKMPVVVTVDKSGDQDKAVHSIKIEK